MARVTVELPSALDVVTGGVRTLAVEGETLAAALDDLSRKLPQLAVHLYDESGEFRQHVLCFHNEKNTRWFDGAGVRLAEGDTIRFLQAVSGG